MTSHRAKKDRHQTDTSKESTVDLRFEQGIEMETRVGTGSIGSKESMPSDADGIGVRKDVAVSYEHA